MNAKFKMGVGGIPALVAAALLSSGCASSKGSGGNPLEGAMAKWKSAGLHDYSYHYQWSCFCPEEYRKAVVITVRRDSIAGVVFAGTRAAVPRENWSRYQTIDGLYTMLQEAVDHKAYRMDVTYDEDFGYPRTASIDYDEHLADEEAYFTADSLRVR
jgi:hypothetical protein